KADDNEVKTEITKLLDDQMEYNAQNDTNDTIKGFRTTNDIAAFVDRYSDVKFDTIYKAKNELSAKFADTLMALPKGGVFGPYRDGSFYKISKMLDRKSNGSIKASYIIIAYTGAQNAGTEITRTKEEAEKKAKDLL